jgi:hypothetical protein
MQPTWYGEAPPTGLFPMQQEVHLSGRQYATAVQAVRRAVRMWHRLDAALVSFPNESKAEAQWEEAWEALRLLDLALYKALTGLLGRSPSHGRDP